MNKIERGKTGLIVLGIISLLFSVGFVVAGIILLINSIVDPQHIQVAKMVFGIVFIILFFPLLAMGIYFTWVGASLKATKGSIVEDNLGMGTMNKALCSNCGAELNGEKFCPNCGKSVMGAVICEKCGTENSDENSHCKNCGEPLNK